MWTRVFRCPFLWSIWFDLVIYLVSYCELGVCIQVILALFVHKGGSGYAATIMIDVDAHTRIRTRTRTGFSTLRLAHFMSHALTLTSHTFHTEWPTKASQEMQQIMVKDMIHAQCWCLMSLQEANMEVKERMRDTIISTPAVLQPRLVCM